MLDVREILADEEAKRIILTLYETGHEVARRVIGRILGTQLSADEKEDLIQEGFLRLVLHVERLKGRTHKEQIAYMAKIMRTVAIDEARRRIQARRLVSLEEIDYTELESVELTPEELLMFREDKEEKLASIRAALDRLPERDRRLLIEKYQNGRSDAEIGNMLDIKPRNVRIYLARARHKISIYYGEEVDEQRKAKQRKNRRPNHGTGRKAESKGT